MRILVASIFAALSITTAMAFDPDCSPTAARCVDDTAGATQEYSTIQAAVNVANPGDTIWVFDGTYAPVCVDDGTHDGTSASVPVTLKAVNQYGALFTTTTAFSASCVAGSGNKAAIVVYGEYIVIDGFEVDLEGADGTGLEYGIAAFGTSGTEQNGAIIRYNKCHGAAKANIFTAFSRGVIVEDNHTYASEDEHGIYVSNSADNPIVRRNLTHDNARAGIHMNADISSGGDGIITGALVDSNIIYGSDLEASGASALSLDGIRSSTIQNNLLWGNGAQNITSFCIDGAAGPLNMVYMYNTVLTGTDGSSNFALKICASCDASGAKSDQGGHKIIGNILLRGSGTNAGSIQIRNTNVLSERNIVSDKMKIGTSTVVTLAGWRAAGYDVNHTLYDVAANLFVDAAANDYHLKAGASAVNFAPFSLAGLVLPNHDLDQEVRPQDGIRDAGCFEGEASGTPAAAPTAVFRVTP